MPTPTSARAEPAVVEDSQAASVIPIPFERQLGFFPRQTRVEYPRTKLTADALGEAEVDDGHRYYLKADANGRPVRASEWIATHLAERVGIAAPHPMIVQMRDGRLVFGSRRIAGVADDVTTANYLLSVTLSNAGHQMIGLSQVLSKIYAFDLFIFNDDRHFGNYLSLDDNGIRRFYAFDFSRALFWRWPWVGIPDPGQNTRLYATRLWPLRGFDTAAAIGILDRLRVVPTSDIQFVVNAMPPEWLPEALREAFLGWWSSNARADRLNELREGMTDGTYL